jgi:hypothetical protein
VQAAGSDSSFHVTSRPVAAENTVVEDQNPLEVAAQTVGLSGVAACIDRHRRHDEAARIVRRPGWPGRSDLLPRSSVIEATQRDGAAEGAIVASESGD